ncbi:hypothetical protein BDA96_10G064100, partial [Sorghum bicolor]
IHSFLFPVWIHELKPISRKCFSIRLLFVIRLFSNSFKFLETKQGLKWYTAPLRVQEKKAWHKTLP